MTGLSNFPSVRLEHAALLPNSGRWFYEVTLLSEGLMQIGWASGSRVAPVVASLRCFSFWQCVALLAIIPRAQSRHVFPQFTLLKDWLYPSDCRPTRFSTVTRAAAVALAIIRIAGPAVAMPNALSPP